MRLKRIPRERLTNFNRSRELKKQFDETAPGARPAIARQLRVAADLSENLSRVFGPPRMRLPGCRPFEVGLATSELKQFIAAACSRS
jgi:hypothetical protein